MRRPVVTVHIVMRNIPDPFSYEVPVAEWRRMRGYFDDPVRNLDVKDFILFETSDRAQTVAVRGGEVQTLTCKPGRRHVQSPRVFPFHFRIHLRKGSTPVFGFTHDPADIAWLMTALDTEPMPIPLFWPVQDSRGEVSTIASADIIIAEMESAVVEEGLKAGW